MNGIERCNTIVEHKVIYITCFVFADAECQYKYYICLLFGFMFVCFLFWFLFVYFDCCFPFVDMFFFSNYLGHDIMCLTGNAVSYNKYLNLDTKIKFFVWLKPSWSGPELWNPSLPNGPAMKGQIWSEQMEGLQQPTYHLIHSLK